MNRQIKSLPREKTTPLALDWIILTAAVVGLAVAAYQSIEGGATALTHSTEAFISEITETPVAGQ
ncbi:hypothetical protein [uncultured Roseobacter sp.]|uniref:hypothetical protein n=1 Tax=uncultured Roseobacter sp. TaxID=114847 RepID=UPI00261BE0A1|nr:hypothetical protein [uncultured Roseobacter sp.]